MRPPLQPRRPVRALPARGPPEHPPRPRARGGRIGGAGGGRRPRDLGLRRGPEGRDRGAREPDRPAGGGLTRGPGGGLEAPHPDERRGPGRRRARGGDPPRGEERRRDRDRLLPDPGQGCLRGQAAGDPQHPRRPGGAVPERVRLRVAALRGPRLQRDRRQPARLLGARPRLQPGHLGRLGRQGLPGRHGRGGRRHRPGRGRPRPSGGRRLELRRHPHRLDHLPDEPLQGRGLGRQHRQRDGGLRHRPLPVGIRGRAGLPLAEHGGLAEALQALPAGGQDQDPHPLPVRRDRLERAPHPFRADVPGVAAAGRAHRARGLSRPEPRDHEADLPEGPAGAVPGLVRPVPEARARRGDARPSQGPWRPPRSSGNPWSQRP